MPFVTSGDGGYTIAAVIPHEACQANARLIAAAPELLEAAVAAQCSCSIRERDSGHLIDCWMPALLDAIAKAEGPRP